MTAARIEKRERPRDSFTAPANWQGGVSYEWVAWLTRDDGTTGRKIARTRRELIEWCADLGITVTHTPTPAMDTEDADRD